jgi:5-methylcytosine-specific restriction protein A
MNRDLIARFHKMALRVYEEGKRATGYRGTRYLQKVRRDGGLGATKSWLNPAKRHEAPKGGFLKLVDAGRLDLSLEAQVIKRRWASLFTKDELDVARNRLARYGYFETKTPSSQAGNALAEELDSETEHIEGAKTTVVVNAFERNRAARDACVSHYGPQCWVCGMTFESVYGRKARGFIHVHHLCPPSAIGREYRIDPVSDLRPVCPNCHAVLHLRKPPFSPAEARKMIAEVRRKARQTGRTRRDIPKAIAEVRGRK